jgi:hypothetical protein
LLLSPGQGVDLTQASPGVSPIDVEKKILARPEASNKVAQVYN